MEDQAKATAARCARRAQGAVNALLRIKKMVGDPDAGPGNARKAYDRAAAETEFRTAVLRMRELGDLLGKLS